MLANKERNIIIQKLSLLVQDLYPFDDLCFEIYKYQSKYNNVYRQYLELLGRLDQEPTGWQDIPCLPIQFFKSNVIKTGSWKAEKIFQSSGTTGQIRSKHHIMSLVNYYKNSQKAFENHFNVKLQDCSFFNLLPGYTDNPDSSLIAMMDYFLSKSQTNKSSYLPLDNKNIISKVLKRAPEHSFLFGVSFALLDLAESVSMDLSHLRIIETGGMKSHKRDVTKSEILSILKNRFNLDFIFSEYGMTELLSQAYTDQTGNYLPANTMKVKINQLNDPFATEKLTKTGHVNIIDLANFDSCAFIATQDLGRAITIESFEILGRSDGSELRGCNLIYDY